MYYVKFFLTITVLFVYGIVYLTMFLQSLLTVSS